MDRFKPFRDAAIEGIKELEKLTARKREIEAEISTLVQLIAGNIAILPASERSDLGIKFQEAQAPTSLRDAIKRALGYRWKSAAEVRDALIESRYDLSTQVNPLASVSTTLRRLEMDKEIESKEEAGRMVYKRKGMQPPPGHFDDLLNRATAARVNKK